MAVTETAIVDYSAIKQYAYILGEWTEYSWDLAELEDLIMSFGAFIPKVGFIIGARDIMKSIVDMLTDYKPTLSHFQKDNENKYDTVVEAWVLSETNEVGFSKFKIIIPICLGSEGVGSSAFFIKFGHSVDSEFLRLFAYQYYEVVDYLSEPLTIHWSYTESVLW